MNTLRYFTPVFWAFLLFLLFCFGTGFIILGTVSAVRGDALVFTDHPSK